MIPSTPTPHVRAKSYEIDDEGTFTSAESITLNTITNRWTFRTQLVHQLQLDAVATAIEKLYLQDFDAEELEVGSFDIDAVVDPADESIILNPGFSVALVQANDAPNTFTIGSAASVSTGLAWSFRTLIRNQLKIGTPYVPPRPEPEPEPSAP